MSLGRRCALALLAVSATMATVAAPGGVVAQSVDCDAPDLDRVHAEVAVARAAVAAGNRAALIAAVESARDQLDAILAACTGGSVEPSALPSNTPQDSLPPVALDETLQADTFTVDHPASLRRLDADVLRSIEREESAEAVTLGDSEATAELASGPLDAPLPPPARRLSLAVGDPAAVLASIGIFDQEDATPESPVAAMAELATLLTEEAPSGPTLITAGAPGEVLLPDGSTGASLEIAFANAESGTAIADGQFLLRGLADGSWALSVAIVPPGALPAFAPVLAAVLASVEVR